MSSYWLKNTKNTGKGETIHCNSDAPWSVAFNTIHKTYGYMTIQNSIFYLIIWASYFFFVMDSVNKEETVCRHISLSWKKQVFQFMPCVVILEYWVMYHDVVFHIIAPLQIRPKGLKIYWISKENYQYLCDYSMIPSSLWSSVYRLNILSSFVQVSLIMFIMCLWISLYLDASLIQVLSVYLTTDCSWLLCHFQLQIKWGLLTQTSQSLTSLFIVVMESRIVTNPHRTQLLLDGLLLTWLLEVNKYICLGVDNSYVYALRWPRNGGLGRGIVLCKGHSISQFLLAVKLGYFGLVRRGHLTDYSQQNLLLQVNVNLEHP